MGRMKRAISEVYEELKRQQKKQGSTLMSKKQKQWRKTGKQGEEEFFKRSLLC
jgi:hypothetical protein